jgi:YgiT-type zinc finger domain-containing protein
MGDAREHRDLDHDLPTGSEAMDELPHMKEETVMKSCPFCKEPLKRKTIEHVHRWRRRLYLFKNVHAEVCSQCGEIFLKPAVLRFMDRCTATGKVGRARMRFLSSICPISSA